MCHIDNLDPCYHAAVPAVRWGAGESARPGMHVSVPLWHDSDVIGWVPGTVVDTQPAIDHLGKVAIVRLSDGTARTFFGYSLGKPGTGSLPAGVS